MERLKFSKLIKAPLMYIGAMQMLEFTLNCINFEKDDVVLDVGCGAGLAELVLAERVRKIVGIDISEPLVAFLNESRRRDNIRFCVYDASRQPPEGFLNVFDKCICVEVLEHVENPRRVLTFIYRSLKPGGVALITFPVDNLGHGRNYFTRQDAIDLFADSGLEGDMRFVDLKMGAFARLVRAFYYRAMHTFKPPRSPDKFEDSTTCEIMLKPRRRYSLVKFCTVLLFMMSPISYQETDQEGWAAILARKM